MLSVLVKQWPVTCVLYLPLLKSGALSFSMEKPVVPVINQMERTFPHEIFRKKRNTFWGIPLFSFSPEWSKNPVHLCRFNSSMLPGELNARLNASAVARGGPVPSQFFSQKVKTDLYKMLKINYHQATVWEVFKKWPADEVYVYL